MPRTLQACLTLCCAFVLAGCAREADSFRPRIIITEPEAGSVSRQNSSVVRGFAMDDRAITAIAVNGQALDIDPSNRKIVPFAFKTSATQDSADYVIEATDSAGQTVKVQLPLRYDPNPPKLEITKFERDGTVLRVTGVATDDVKVSSITVDGSKLGVAGTKRVPFYAESSGEYVDVVVTDVAGNKTTQRVR